MARPKKEDASPEVPEDDTTIPDRAETPSNDVVKKVEAQVQETVDTIEDKGYIGSHPEDLKDGGANG